MFSNFISMRIKSLVNCSEKNICPLALSISHDKLVPIKVIFTIILKYNCNPWLIVNEMSNGCTVESRRWTGAVFLLEIPVRHSFVLVWPWSIVLNI